MATAPKKKAASAAKPEPKPEGRFARLRREAAEVREKNGRSALKDLTPYVIDDVEPPIVIAPPSIDVLLEVAELTTPSGGVEARNIRRVFKLYAGDQFERLIQLIVDADGDEYDMMIVINDLRRHFTPGAGSDDVPGK
ncbi:hypothetical protein K8O93_01185 [Gordonia bronchialis]|uniref:hypothetical protein n=1 Tax=Gordonia bronchialis TaxID=2054 RepID=UPI001CBCFCD4|nr:hypothetical protein [Gordonia bronchialis]UAK38448.1 hypothetical protein K8O93_01185 [Gordonia bronchialis]